MNNETLGGKPFIPECKKHKGQNWIDCIYCAIERNELDVEIKEVKHTLKTQNTENKTHEEILEKYHRDTIWRPEGNHVYRGDALEAMAEVAGLRDKKVEQNEYVISMMNKTINKQIDIVKEKNARISELESLLKPLKDAWDKEVEGKYIRQYLDKLKERDNEIEELRKYWEELYVEKANDVNRLLKEIEQLKETIKQREFMIENGLGYDDITKS